MQVTGLILFMSVFTFLAVDVILIVESQGATRKMMENSVASAGRVSVDSNIVMGWQSVFLNSFDFKGKTLS